MILSEIRSMRWTDFFLHTLLDPRALYRMISRNEPRCFLLSFTVPAAVAVIDIITLSLLGRETSFFYYKVTYGWILVFLAVSLKIIIAAALMDTASQFFGFKGNMRELIILVNFSLFPDAFILPLVYIFKIFRFAPIFFFILFNMGLSVWSALIAVQGISEMHGAGIGKSVMIYLFPVLLVGTILSLIVILLVICGVGYLTG
ncbi:MAG: hypothetical protein A2W19_12760 [Spirochaetes bacterium RBG_16_49_21]|nr:MAG: hypothetical protein A2W19_12760 [Spirochaetes bacterium RBG_16_49_21]